MNFPPIGTPIGILSQYCEHHNMSYISQSTNNISWNHALPARNRTNFWILRIGRKEPRTVQQVLGAISSQQLTGKWNKVHVITSRRDKNIVITNLQVNRCIFNKIRHIQTIGNKLISLPKKLPTPDHIGDVVKISLRSDWYDSIFQTMIKWNYKQHSVHHF